MGSFMSFKSKADVMYEETMDQVRQEIDAAYVQVEKLSLMIEEATDDPYERSKMDDQIGKIIEMLEKI